MNPFLGTLQMTSPNLCGVFIMVVLVYAVAGSNPRSLDMLGKFSPTELHPTANSEVVNPYATPLGPKNECHENRNIDWC